MMLSRYAYALTLIGWGSLIASLFWWHMQPAGWGVTAAALLCLPLLLPLPGILRGKTYTYGWASLMLLFYMVYVLTEWVGSPAGRLALPAALSAVAMFCGCLIYVRLRARERGD